MDLRRGIVAGWLADGSGRALIRRQLLTFRAGRIHRIRPATGEDLESPGIIDWSGGLVIPGLIDSHVHMFMSATPDPAVREKQLAASFEDLAPVMDRHVRRHLAAGIVAVRDGGDYGGHALRYRDTVLARSGAPLILRAAGRAWRMPGRYGRLIGRPAAAGQGIAAAIGNCREPIDHVKLVNSGLNSLRTYGRPTRPQFDPQALARGVAAARTRGWPVMVHANGAQPVGAAIAAGARSIEHGFFMGRDNLERLAARAVTWVPTTVTMQGYCVHSDPHSTAHEISRRNRDHQLAQLRRAHAVGVDVAAGTDAGTIGVPHGRSLGAEIALLMQAGFSAAEAIRCATSNGARLLDLPALGQLAVGRQATLVGLAGGPEAFPGSLDAPALLVVAGRPVFGADDRAPAAASRR
jgi:imidazolonepropionase-like amidohydrolase